MSRVSLAFGTHYVGLSPSFLARKGHFGPVKNESTPKLPAIQTDWVRDIVSDWLTAWLTVDHLCWFLHPRRPHLNAVVCINYLPADSFGPLLYKCEWDWNPALWPRFGIARNWNKCVVQSARHSPLRQKLVATENNRRKMEIEFSYASLMRT